MGRQKLEATVAAAADTSHFAFSEAAPGLWDSNRNPCPSPKLTLLAKPADGYAGLLAAHDEVGMMLRHAARPLRNDLNSERAAPWAASAESNKAGVLETGLAVAACV